MNGAFPYPPRISPNAMPEVRPKTTHTRRDSEQKETGLARDENWPILASLGDKWNGSLTFIGDSETKNYAELITPWIIDNDDSSNQNNVYIKDAPVRLTGSAPDGRPTIDVDNLSSDDFDIVDENNNFCTISNGKVLYNGTPVKGAVSFLPKGSVEVKPTGITLDKTSYTFTSFVSIILKATFTPENTTDKTLTWKTDKEEVALVDQNGKVTPVGNGTTKLTATTSNGFEATCQVTVEINGPASITLNPSELTIDAEDTDAEYEIRALFDNPDEIGDTRLNWTVEGNSDLVEIVRSYTDYLREDDYFGWLGVCEVKLKDSPTAVPEGTCKLVATAATGGKRAECVITVHKTVWAQRVQFIDQSGAATHELNFDGTGQLKHLTAKVYPENAENVEFKMLGNWTANGVNQIAQMPAKSPFLRRCAAESSPSWASVPMPSTTWRVLRPCACPRRY